MKIAVATLWTSGFGDWCAPVNRIRQQYCDRHGYELIHVQATLDPTRHPAWSKLMMLMQVMLNHKPTWVLWQDADSMFMNLDTALTTVIDKYPKADVIVGCDPKIARFHREDAIKYGIPEYVSLNTGHMLWKNTDHNLSLLSAMYNDYHYARYWSAPYWDQNVVAGYYTGNTRGFANTCAIVKPDHLFNSNHEDYEEGDLFLHLYGERDRYHIFKDFSKRIICDGYPKDFSSHFPH
jgi:hypothetical protein